MVIVEWGYKWVKRVDWKVSAIVVCISEVLLQFISISRFNPIHQEPVVMDASEIDVLVAPPSSFSIHPTKPRNANFNPNLCFSVTASPSADPLPLRWPGYSADHLRVAHLQVRRAIGGCLSGDLRSKAAKLVPATAIETKQREGVGRSVERHGFRLMLKNVIIGVLFS